MQIYTICRQRYKSGLTGTGRLKKYPQIRQENIGYPVKISMSNNVKPFCQAFSYTVQRDNGVPSSIGEDIQQ